MRFFYSFHYENLVYCRFDVEDFCFKFDVDDYFFELFNQRFVQDVRLKALSLVKVVHVCSYFPRGKNSSTNFEKKMVISKEKRKPGLIYYVIVKMTAYTTVFGDYYFY